ncbi:MAG: hypothetical protein Q9M35_05945 [Rhodothermus sp.]|nr:hypothetical protein [Rhodothermus sp.]
MKVCVLTGAILLLTGCALIEPGKPVAKLVSECDEQPLRLDVSRFSRNTSLLPGKWQWVKTTAYATISERPWVQTPCSAGYTETLLIRPEGTVEVYRNDTLAYRQSLQEFLDRHLIWGIYYRDLLMLSSAPVDGLEHLYVRTR